MSRHSLWDWSSNAQPFSASLTSSGASDLPTLYLRTSRAPGDGPPGRPGNKKESGNVSDASPAVLQPGLTQVERGVEDGYTRQAPAPLTRRARHQDVGRPEVGRQEVGGPGVAGVNAQDGVPGQAHWGRAEAGNGHSRLNRNGRTVNGHPGNNGHVNGSHAGNAQAGNGQAGQVFADLLLVGATSARSPLALLTVASNDGWSTLCLGADREALEDAELFDIIASRREPVEVTDPATNPALANSRLARSTLGIRWLLGVPLLGPTGDVNAIFAVLDTEPRQLDQRQRAAMMATGRLVSAALSAHRAADHLPVPPPAPEQADGAKRAVDGHSLLRSHEVAALFDVTERTVINWAASGKLACLRTVGGHLRFRSEDVMSLLEANSLRRPSGV